MTMTYILVANAHQAHVYSAPKAKLFNGSSTLSLVTEMSHPENRERNHDLVSDKSGNRQSKFGGHGTCVQQSEPHDQEVDRFARSVAEDLHESYLSDKYQDLIIIAPPQFHGMLKDHLPAKLSHVVSCDITKDYTGLAANQLVQRLQAYL